MDDITRSLVELSAPPCWCSPTTSRPAAATSVSVEFFTTPLLLKPTLMQVRQPYADADPPVGTPGTKRRGQAWTTCGSGSLIRSRTICATPRESLLVGIGALDHSMLEDTAIVEEEDRHLVGDLTVGSLGKRDISHVRGFFSSSRRQTGRRTQTAEPRRHPPPPITQPHALCPLRESTFEVVSFSARDMTLVS